MGIWSRIRTHRHDIVPITGGVSSTLQIKYDIRETVSSTLEVQYNIRQLVSDTLEVVYKIRNTISTDLDLRYNINGVVNVTLELVYKILAGTVTVSPKLAKSVGQQLPKMNEHPPEKILVVPQVSMEVYAGVIAPVETTMQVQGRLRARISEQFHAKSESLMKKVESVAMSCRLTSPVKHKVELKSALKMPYNPEIKLECKLSYKPLYEFLRKNLLTIYGYQHFEFTVEKYYFESIVSFKNSSSFVGLVVYDSDTLELSIFLNGQVYVYFNVDQRTYDAFSGSPSPGAFFARNIRDQFSFAK